MTISIAIPCYKSAHTLPQVVSDIQRVFHAQKKYDYQLILVNDYPFDNTFSVIKGLCENDDNIVGINLSKNYGQTAAKMAALPYFKGDVLVYMDDDGQHPAEGIIPLAEKVLEGYDAVYAYFKDKHHSAFKKLTSGINSKVLELNGTKVKGVHLSSFYALSAFAVKAYQDYNSPFPSMGGYLNSIAGKVTEIELEHHDRLSGSSNYSLKKLLKLWLNGFTNFSVIPLRVIAFIGILIAIAGFLFAAYVIIRKFVIDVSIGYTSIVSTILIIGGIILFSLGFIGEYIGRIYMTVSNLQQYKIREIIQHKEDENNEQ